MTAFCSNFLQPLISLVHGTPSTHLCTMFRCLFSELNMIYKYIDYIYIYIIVCASKKKHILCALYFGETLKLVIFCMMKTLMRKTKIYR